MRFHWLISRRLERLCSSTSTGCVIAAVSFVLAPALWFAWVDRLTGDTGTAGEGYMAILLVRVALAAGVVNGRAGHPIVALDVAEALPSAVGDLLP